MSEKYPGGFVTYNPPTPSQTSATGIWTLSQQEQYQQAGLWPNSPSQISRSLRFNSADSAFLRRTPTYASNRQTWTWSGWVKRSAINGTYQNIFQTIGAAGGDNDYFSFRIMNGEQIGVVLYSYFPLISTQVLRDVSAWYHFVCVLDTTQATASNRLKIYINGVEVTAWSTDNRSSISQNSNLGINSAAQHNIGAYNGSSEFFSGYMANVQFVDGQALTPTSFGEYNVNTGVWQPLQKNLTYGTNGFQLTFNDNTNTTATTLGADSSGNGNNWTPSNFSVTTGANNDSMVDSPTSYGTDTGVGGTVRGNYCTVNSLLKDANLTIANGNLALNTSSAGWTTAYGTFLIPTSGKWYWEVTAGGSNTNPGIALSTSNLAGNLATYPANIIVSYTYYGANGNRVTGPGNTSVAYGATFTTNDVVGMALDMDAGTLTFYKNNSSQGTAFSSLTGTYVPVFGVYDTGVQSVNFGQRPFAYTAPSGFKALCTQNLPTPTIGATSTTLANKYYDANLYTGNGSTQSITNTGSFQPDFVWIKSRSNSYSNFLFDAVRGTNKSIFSNNTNVEVTDTDALTAFNSNGFTMGAKADINGSGATYVGWQWKANGTGSSNTAGSITSTVSANTTSGFSIVTYTGTGTNATVGHGLGVAPNWIIVKRRNVSEAWGVRSNQLTGNNYSLLLNSTAAESSSYSPPIWGTASPTSTVFSIGTSTASNQSTGTYVAYCFAPIAGYSAMGSYTGNGSTDGPFVFTGMRPAWIMFKKISGADGWIIMDSKRNTYNIANAILQPNNFAGESVDSTNYAVDFLSNGFKIRNSSTYYNESGGTLIFAAFAENPFKYSLAR